MRNGLSYQYCNALLSHKPRKGKLCNIFNLDEKRWMVPLTLSLSVSVKVSVYLCCSVPQFSVYALVHKEEILMTLCRCVGIKIHLIL